MRFRRSGMFIMFFTLSATSATDDLHSTARCLYFGESGRTKFMSSNDQNRFQIPLSEDLHSAFVHLGPNSLSNQFLRCNRCPGLKCVQLRQIHGCEFAAENIVKSALGNAPAQRHLTTFKTEFQRMSSPRSLSFISFACSLSMTRSRT